VENLCHVFQELKDDNFNINFEKCEYGKLKIIFPCKTKPFKTNSKLKVEMWEPFSIPRHQSFVSFLLAHWVHYFLSFFPKLVMPLNNILKQCIRFKWHSEYMWLEIWCVDRIIPLMFKVIYFTTKLWMSTIFIYYIYW
jgi:hypothetical protein